MSTNRGKLSSSTLLFSAGLVLCTALCSVITATSDKPNIIIIMADDLVSLIRCLILLNNECYSILGFRRRKFPRLQQLPHSQH